MHNDQILHFLSLMKAPLVDFEPDDALTLSKIPSLLLFQSSAQIGPFASNVLRLFESYAPFDVIRRCCLVKRLGAANMLYVVSSHQTLAQPNRMTPGYFCFVKPDSSLLRLMPSDVRSFEDAQNVAQSFAKTGSPPQRSIRLIAEAGFKSGLCLPLTIRRQVRSYLFFNSITATLNDLRPVDYVIFSFLQAVATSLMSNQDLPSDRYDWLAEQLPDSYLADFLSPSGLQQAIQQHAAQLHHSIHIGDLRLPSTPLLVSHGNIANLACRFARLARAGSVRVEAMEADERVHFDFEFDQEVAPEHDGDAFRDLERDCRALEVRLKIRPKGIALEVLKDLGDSKRGSLYSI